MAAPFYLLIKLKTDLDDMEIVNQLIDKFKVAVIPGHTFGMLHGCYPRIAFGSPDKETADGGIMRLINGLKSIIKTQSI